MSFLIFQLLYAALAVGLLIVAVLVVRPIARKRQQGASEPVEAAPEQAEAAPEVQSQRKFGLARKVVEPEPEEPEAAPVRRRLLQSFADAERSAAEAETVVLPVAVLEAEAETEIEPDTVPGGEAEIALAEPEAEPDADYSEEVLGRLEDAFEALQSGEITIDAYRARVMAEETAVEQRISALQDSGDAVALEGALAARDSVHWCLDWAEEQAAAQAG